MLQEGLRHYSHVSLVAFGMLLFMGVFIGVLIQLARNPKHLKDVSQLPLGEENHE